MSDFTIEQTENIIKISCPPALDAEAASTFADQAKAWMLKPAEHFVLDMAAVTEISREFYKVIIQLKTNLRKDHKFVHSLNLNAALLKRLKSDGVELAFNPIKALDEILIPRPQEPGKAGFDVEFMNPFLSAIQKTFEVQCNTKVSIAKPYLKKKPDPDVAVAGVLSLASNGFAGCIVLCFTTKVFLKIYENMFQEKHETITPEIEDAAGELLNIIYGAAKIELNNKGYNFQKALPTVLCGEKITVRHSGVKPAVVIPVKSDAGDFHVEIEFQNK